MQAARLCPDEPERLAAVQALGLIESAPESRFDRFVHIARKIADAPIASLTLVERDRQWFKSVVGVTLRQIHRDLGISAHAILESTELYVPDTCLDARFADSPLVVGEPLIRFYAGYPLRTPSGHAVGTLAVLDRMPRELDDHQRTTLRELADCLERELALHVLLGQIKQFQNSAKLLTSPAYVALTTGRMPRRDW
jgi:GAF domain-containing protein